MAGFLLSLFSTQISPMLASSTPNQPQAVLTSSPTTAIVCTVVLGFNDGRPSSEAKIARSVASGCIVEQLHTATLTAPALRARTFAACQQIIAGGGASFSSCCSPGFSGAS